MLNTLAIFAAVFPIADDNGQVPDANGAPRSEVITHAEAMRPLIRLKAQEPRNATEVQMKQWRLDLNNEIAEALDGKRVRIDCRVRSVTWRDGFARINWANVSRGIRLPKNGHIRKFINSPVVLPMTEADAAELRQGDPFTWEVTLHADARNHALVPRIEGQRSLGYITVTGRPITGVGVVRLSTSDEVATFNRTKQTFQD